MPLFTYNGFLAIGDHGGPWHEPSLRQRKRTGRNQSSCNGRIGQALAVPGGSHINGSKEASPPANLRLFTVGEFQCFNPYRSLNNPTPSTAKYPAMKAFQLDRPEIQLDFQKLI